MTDIRSLEETMKGFLSPTSLPEKRLISKLALQTYLDVCAWWGLN